MIFAVVLVGSGIWLVRHYQQGPSSPQENPKKGGVLLLDLPERASVSTQFTATLSVDTQGKAINAVGAYLQFDPQFIQLANLDTTSSFCQFYPEKKFDNQQGMIRIACGSPNPGFKGVNTLAKFKFTTLRQGVTKIKILPESQILLNNGYGTNILNNFPEFSILIVNNL